MNRAQKLAAVNLAAQALAYTRIGDWYSAAEVTQELHATYPGGIQVMLLALADTQLKYQNHQPRADAVVQPLWINPDTGDTSEADEVPPPVRWAGRFIAARACLDMDACAALWDSISSSEEFTDNICAVLQTVAATVNRIKGVPQ